MSKIERVSGSRREFLVTSGTVAAASVLAGMVTPPVHAAEDNTLQVALIGCGGRGTGAAVNALKVKQGPIKLVAMADVFENRLSASLKNLKESHAHKVDVPPERQFVGFDGYKNAMDCLKPGDIAIFTTPLAFRGVHYSYAIEKGLNVFMEKPLTADGPTSRRMLEINKQATAKNLKVGVGLMARHQPTLIELAKRIKDGEIGDIIMMRAYRMAGPGGSAFSKKWPGRPSKLLWQINNFHSFIWASGGMFNDFNIHLIDHCCWMKDAWPIKAHAIGGRHYRSDYVDQNFDSYSVEYTFADGAKLIMDGRAINGCYPINMSFAHGTKGMAIISKRGDCGQPSSTYEGQDPDRSKLIWQSKVAADRWSPFQIEWDDLVDAIRNDKPYNEVERSVEASLVSSLGRLAAHTGQEITLEELRNSETEYAPGVDKLTMDSPGPLLADADGKYPVPLPGLIGKREY